MKPLEEIKKMLTEISSWPWQGSEHIRFSINTETRHVAMVSSGRETEKEKGQNYANFRFILNSPQIISDLVQEVERLKAAIKFALGPDKGCEWHEIQKVLEEALETQRR